MSKHATHSINRAINQFLASERKKRNITQAEIAARLQKPQSFVSKYENGQRQLTAADLIAVCKAIGLKPARFFQLFEQG